MSINFPSTPAEGTAYTFNGVTYTFTSGVWMPAGGGGGGAAGRELVTADRTYYVRPDGSDANNGLANTAGGAFRTIAKGIASLCAVDLSIYAGKVKVGGVAFWTVPVELLSGVGGSSFTLEGDPAAPGNCNLNITGADAISMRNLRHKWLIDGFQIKTTTSGSCIFVQGSTLDYKNIIWDSSAGVAHVYGVQGASVTQVGNDVVIGGGGSHITLQVQSKFGDSSNTTTINGSPNFSSGYYNLDTLCSVNTYLPTYTGAATGPRYQVTGNSVLQSYGTMPPGSTAGTVGTGGIFI